MEVVRSSPARAGSKSSPAACSAARAKSSSAGCAARRSPGSGSRSSSRPSTTASPTTTSSRTATCGSPSRTAATRRRAAARRSSDDTEVVGIDEGQFFDADLPAACNDARRPRQARHRRRSRSGLPRAAVRADAAAAGHRRVHHQDARHLHGVRQSRPTTRSASCQQRPRAARRQRHSTRRAAATVSIRRWRASRGNRARRLTAGRAVRAESCL